MPYVQHGDQAFLPHATPCILEEDWRMVSNVAWSTDTVGLTAQICSLRLQIEIKSRASFSQINASTSKTHFRQH